MDVGKGVFDVAKMTVPGFVINGFKLFHNAHRVFYWQKRFETLIQDQKSIEQYTKGMIVSAVIDQTIIQKPYEELVNIISFGHTMLQSISNMYALVDSYRELAEEVYRDHLFRVKVSISAQKKDLNLSALFTNFDPALEIWTKTSLNLLAIRIENLAIHLFALGWAAFALSSSLAELVERYSSKDGFAKMDQKNRFFLNLSDMMEELKRNREIIEQEFKKNQQMIDSFLRVVGSETIVHMLKNYAFKSISYCETGVEISQPLVGVANATFEGINFLTGNEKKNVPFVMISTNSIEKKVNLAFQGIILTI